MELMQHDVTTTHKVGVTVEDGIVIKSVHNKDMKVTRLLISYTVDDGQWVSQGVSVYGFRIKQDGTMGQRSDEQVFGWPKRYPAWVEQVVEHYRPKDPAPQPAVPFCIVEAQD